MSILIKGMEMPTSCSNCPIGDELCCMLMPGVPALWEEYAIALRTNRRHEECPLVPVPKHGRLIDADALEREIDKNITDYYETKGGGYYLAEDVIGEVRIAPTIIEAEEDE